MHIYIYTRIYTYAYLCIHMHLVCWRALCSWDWFWPGGPVRCSASPVMSFHFVRVKRVRLRDEELQALPCTWHTSIRICIGVEVELISLPWVRFFHFVELCSWPSWMMSKKKATAPQETKKWLLEFKYKVRPWGFWSKSRTRWGLPFNLASFCWLRRHRHIFFDGTGGRGRSSMLLEAKLWPLKSLPMLPFAWKILHHSRLKPQKGWHTVVDKKLH